MTRTCESVRIPFRVKPMLATLVPEPFHKLNWVYEEKYDGIRILAYKAGSKLSLITRNGIDRTGDFPKIVDAVRHLRPSTLLLDGVFSCCKREALRRNMLSSTACLRMAETSGRSR
jgi:ATP-dependent DNA ligase